MTTLILTHGAGGNRNMPLLIALQDALTPHKIDVIRYDLPFRQERPHGPPRPGDAARDQAGLREAVLKARAAGADSVWLGGQSYGGRQSSMLVAEEPDLVYGLLLLSYPLHPPGKRDQLRTAHLPKLTIPVLFVHGSKDPFGSLEEIRSAMTLIPGRTELLPIENAGHDLGKNKHAAAIAQEFIEFVK